MIDQLDPNVIQFEILLHLDDRSVVSLLSTCKLIYNMLSIDEYISGKLKLIDEEILGTCSIASGGSSNGSIDNSNGNTELLNNNITTDDEGNHEVITERSKELFKKAYLNFRNEMFTIEPTNFIGTVKVDPIQLCGPLKSKYLLLKRLIFKKDNTTTTTDCTPIYNDGRSIISSREGFWMSHPLDFTISKENVIYYWSVLLSRYDRAVSNSWVILIGFSTKDSVSSITKSWIPSGYCVKSNAKLESSTTSYTESTINKEGDLIGIECYIQKNNIFFNVYHPGLGGEDQQQQFQFKSDESKKLSIVPMISLVQSPSSFQMVSILPWDGRVETLKRFGSDE